MITKIINTINENGIVKIDKFLNQDEVKEMQNIVSFYSAPKNSKNSYWSTKYSSLILKVLKLNFVKLKHNVKILRLEKRKKIKNIANSYFSKECT